MTQTNNAYSNVGRPADCSSPSTRKKVRGYVTPNDTLVRTILNLESVSQKTFRIYNGSNYQERKAISRRSQWDLSSTGINRKKNSIDYNQSLELTPAQCNQGDLSPNLATHDCHRPYCPKCR